MKQQEVFALITKIAAIDPRFVAADEMKIREKAMAWSDTLLASMPFRWALDEVSRFYGREVRTIMPADLNLPWRSVRADELERGKLAALDSGGAVPMPDYVRDMIHRP